MNALGKKRYTLGEDIDRQWRSLMVEWGRVGCEIEKIYSRSSGRNSTVSSKWNEKEKGGFNTLKNN